MKRGHQRTMGSGGLSEELISRRTLTEGSWTSFTCKTKLGPNFFSNLIGSDDDHIYGRRNLSESDLNSERLGNPDYTCKSANLSGRKRWRCIWQNPAATGAAIHRPAVPCGHPTSSPAGKWLSASMSSLTVGFYHIYFKAVWWAWKKY